MSIVKIPVRDILPIIPFKADRDIRYYLNGIYIEPVEGGGVTIIATDGATMAAIHSKDGYAAEPTILEWSKLLNAQARAALKVHADARIELEAKDARLVVKAKDAEVFVQAGRAVIEAKYPDWKKAVPTDAVPGLPAVYQAKYLLKAMKAGEVFGKYSGVKFFHSAAKPDASALVVRYSAHPELLCMVMPMRDDLKLDAVPAWAVKPVIVEQQAAA